MNTVLDNTERAELFGLHAEFCKILSDANRLLIISELARKELSVNDLARRLDIKQSNTSRHLSLMKEHGMVNTRKEGTTVYYHLSDIRVYQAITLLRKVQSDLLKKRTRLSGIDSKVGMNK